ncbi:uncharacterized protein A4U43_C01F21610 [Asparagus officinalis]|uniref:Uncharacterized protein n=1 Tax=Asparagus officinalis TaxID=4686 RepID=A0A5P1FTM6_ASPOF|nr:uncharacterized protein LOC109826968 isoform X4 [Asparagus officinalis]XP_020255640.1 uncharacterized protein LOC109832657 isoform X4 [Asparagus officinalis]ONK73977.1 uncharacterized protein A4U43_C03F1530 [Asparagus officinalis]ONK80777.1 uncharacterized protein A4U43_C01F21610 [Asparagus officinalis]
MLYENPKANKAELRASQVLEYFPIRHRPKPRKLKSFLLLASSSFHCAQIETECQRQAAAAELRRVSKCRAHCIRSFLLITGIPGYYEAFWKEMDDVKQIWKNRKQIWKNRKELK